MHASFGMDGFILRERSVMGGMWKIDASRSRLALQALFILFLLRVALVAGHCYACRAPDTLESRTSAMHFPDPDNGQSSELGKALDPWIANDQGNIVGLSASLTLPFAIECKDSK